MSKLRKQLFVLLLIPCVLLSEAMVVVPLFLEMNRPPEGHGTMDSIAIYVAADPNQSLVFATDKDDNFVEVHNPVTNTYLGKIGGTGTGPGQLQYPNGVGVAYNVPTGSGMKDLLFVVERDNHRVSIFSLPDRSFITHFGSTELVEPYGIAFHWNGRELQAWITDTDPTPDRVYVYRIIREGTGLKGVLSFSFPASGSLESIVIDPAAQRALLCDETGERDVMVYDLQGKLITRFGKGLFVNQPEGIVLYDLGNGEGYVIVSDQNVQPFAEYEVFDRKTYQALGNFSGETKTTDGIALTQAALPNLPQGSFHAMHSDDVVHIYDWNAIAKALNLGTKVISPRATTAVAEHPQPAVPDRFEILSNYPNPFNPATTIRYRIARLAHVRVEIHSANGDRIAELKNELHAPGRYELSWAGRNDSGEAVVSGVYFVRLDVEREVYSRKILLVR
ncbi:MAG: T9SS type A sorting domain-containing protein [bacterium]